MNKMNAQEIARIIEKSTYTVVHVDADWDGYRFQINDKITDAKKEFGNRVSFAYVDCDKEQEYASAIGVLNTPSVAYYCGSNLMALIIGIEQNVSRNINKLIRSEDIEE